MMFRTFVLLNIFFVRKTNLLTNSKKYSKNDRAEMRLQLMHLECDINQLRF